MKKEEFTCVGQSVTKVDVLDKVLGRAVYSEDMTFPGMLHGRVLRAGVPHAVIEDLGQETGLLIAAVESASPADQAGLLLGDTIVALDGVETRQYDDLLALLGSEHVDQLVSVKFVRGGQVQSLDLTIGEKA